MYLSPEEKAIGKENFHAAIGNKLVRRDLLKDSIKADLAPRNGLGPKYYGYGGSVSEPVRVGVIGTGDEGGVLIGAINPNYITVKSIADIRPYNVWRAFHGDFSSNSAHEARPGLIKVYEKVFKWKTEEEARKNIKVYDHSNGGYEELIKQAKQDGIEAVIIALPLHLHAPAAIKAMKAGLHVLTEKLMAHTVRECKEMARVAAQEKKILAVGHQRHYNILYDHAVELIRKGLLGDVHHIRAQWHRGNLPGKDSWQQPMPRKAKPNDLLANELDEKLAAAKSIVQWLRANNPKAAISEKHLEAWSLTLEQLKDQLKRDKGNAAKAWKNKADQVQAQVDDLYNNDEAKKFGYVDGDLKDASGKVIYSRPAIEELMRWRLWDRTSAGLMAELGGHQLDAAEIFIHAMHRAHDENAEKPRPLSVAAAGNRPLFPADRDVEDHVYCIVEFPAPGYDAKDPLASRKKIGVQYASINGNGFGGYGETVFGTEGTLVLETENDAMLFRTHETTSKTKVAKASSGPRQGFPALQIDEKGDPESAAIGTLGVLPADRGYTAELEHWAWCIRNPDPKNQPRCGPEMALGDAVIALTTNIAARKGERIEFKKEWFDINSDAAPEDEK